MGTTELAIEETRLAPAEAFAIIGNETRLEILQILSEEKFRPMPFAELRKCVGMRDGSQFNYHLKKLEGPFIRGASACPRTRRISIRVSFPSTSNASSGASVVGSLNSSS